jgi:hypothetical protein
MKKLLSLILITGSVWAAPVEVKKPIICDNTETVLKLLSGGNYQEKPIWLGASDEKLVNYSLWVNDSTKNWTIVQFNNEIACILGTGEAYTTFGSKKPIL